jgi:PAS domain S-box-containing protein
MPEKRAEPREGDNAVSHSEYLEQIESLVDSIDLAIFALNRHGNVIVWNRAMERHFLNREEALDKHVLTALPAFKTEQQGVNWGDVLLRNVVEEGRSIEVRRYRLRTRLSDEHPFDIKAFPLTSRNGEITGAVVLLHDVREQIAFEEQQLLNARTTSLSNLGASLAHEIRNPLNSISLNVQLLRERLMQLEIENRDALLENVDTLLNEIGRLNLIIKDFLEFSRPSSMKNELVNPNEIIGRSLELLKEDARRKDIEIIVDFGDLPEVLLDRNQITQVFYNIALNAIQAMEKGGKLEIVSRQRGEWVVMEFTDNGPGIPEKDLSLIFDLFYTAKEGGTGLGLAIASRLVDNHHGHIGVNSRLGRGTTFSVSLPVKIISR